MKKNRFILGALVFALAPMLMAQATQLVITTQPGGGDGGTTWGVTEQPVVEAQDAGGVLDATYNGTVTAEITAATGTPGAALLGTVSVQAVAGVAAFTDLAIDLAGTAYTLTFTDTVTPLTDAVSDPFDIAVGPAADLLIAIQPDGATEGVPFTTQPEVHIVDAGGNLVVTDNATQVQADIAVGSGTAGAMLMGTTLVTAASGVVSFTDLAIDLAGLDYMLDFSAVTFTTVTSDPFSVAGAPDHLHIAVQPGGAVENSPFVTQPVIEIRDAGGNVVTSDDTTVVTATLIAGAGNLGGTLTATASAGVATFADLEIDAAGSGFQIEFTSSPVLTPATSELFDVAGVATQLGIRTQPSGAQPGAAFSQQPVIEIQDAAGALVATDNTTEVTVSISPASGAPGAVLSGTLTVMAVNGVATFTDLSIDLAGGNYTLDFADQAAVLMGVTSASFDVSAPPSGNGGSKKKKDDGCSTGTGQHGLLTFGGLLAALMLVLRAGRGRKAS